MNENINLCEILKGHECEIFWSDVFGLLTLVKVHEEEFVSCRWDNTTVVNFFPDGSRIKGERCTLFPSRNQRDWNKWVEEQKSKVPKTWNDIEKQENRICSIFDSIGYAVDYKFNTIEKSALAILKIHQLIDSCYGGNVTNEEWKNAEKIKYVIACTANRIFIIHYTNCIHPIAFHTKEQAEEFLKYPENVQLLKDYFMI